MRSLPFASLLPFTGRIFLMRYSPRLPVCMLDLTPSGGSGESSGGGSGGDSGAPVIALLKASLAALDTPQKIGNINAFVPSQVFVFTIRNDGIDTLHITSVVLSQQMATITTPPGSLVLAPGAITTFTTTSVWTSEAVGIYAGFVTILSDDPDGPTAWSTFVQVVASD